MSGEDAGTTGIDNIDALIATGEALAEVVHRVMEIHHPESDTTKVIAALVQTDDGGKHVAVADDIMAALDARLPGPRSRECTVRLAELGSLVAYVNRYKSANAIAWADPARFAISVVFDDHPVGSTGTAWRKHRAEYTCPRSAEWQTWCATDGKPMGQAEFGDFIEARLEDLRGGDGFPKPLEVLAMARNLVMRIKGTFERQINPTTGAGILVNKTETEQGSTEIPRAFLLGIPVFEGGANYQVEARVRFAISEGRPAFSYTLHRRKEIERDAFNDVRELIAEQAAILVLAGVP